MYQFKFALLALSLLACTALPAQDEVSSFGLDQPTERPKGDVALSIHLGSASTRYIGRRSDGTYANKWGIAPVLGLGLRFNRPNQTSHIIGVDLYPQSSIIRNANGTIIGGEPGMLGSYEFRKYRDFAGTPLKYYYGAWVQASGIAASSTGTGTNVLAEMNLGVSAGLHYDISKRFFIEGGVRVGVASLKYQRDGFSGGSFEIGRPRNLLQASAGFGIRL